MEQPPSGIPRPSSGIPRPTSRLPVLRPAASQGLSRTPSTEQLRKKPSLSSISRTGQPPSSLQKKPSLSTISSRASQPPPSLQKKASRSSLARSSVVPPVSANTSSNRTSVLSTKRSIPSLTQPRASVADASVFKKPIGPPHSRQTRTNPQLQKTTAQKPQNDDVLGNLGAFRSASRASSRASSRAGFYDNEPSPVLVDDDVEAPTPAIRKPRASLSERTIESLSQLPSSPAAGKVRRRSSFFGNGESMGPPARPASALSNGRRPTTSDGTPRDAPATPKKSTLGLQRGSMTVPGKRSVSAVTSSTSATPSRISSVARTTSMLKKPPLSQIQNLQSTPKARPLSNSKTMVARTPTARPSIGGTFGQAISPPAATPVATPLPAKKTPETTRKAPSSSAALREQLAKAKAVKRAPVTTGPTTASSKPKSSQALREQIAKAREAARRTTATSPPRPRTNTPPRDAIIPDPVEIASFDFGLEDPFNQHPKGGASLLRKRVDAARADGKLNIAAMSLNEIPEEVLNMYQYDPNANTAWGEVVDLTTMIAADNDLQSLPESMFPDMDYEAAMESDEVVPQFGGIQSLDLHGNSIRELPMGLRRLPQLSRLNLTRNKMSMDSLDVVFQIPTLRDLKLAENKLEGAFPSSVETLTLLETLELQGNKLTSLPPEIRALTRLRALNISNNNLSSLPSEVFTSMSVIDLNASKNSFSGAFFQVDIVPNLQNLYLANNSLTSLCVSETVSLPSMKHLNLSANRLSTLPNMSDWKNLTTLLVGENSLSSIPEGFCSLSQLRNADFTGNNIDKLDHCIALMEALHNLTLAANPLRERKYLTMNAEDIKRDLFSRLDPATVPGADLPEDAADLAGEELSAEDNGWKLTPSGTLDLSSQNMTEVDEAIASFAESHNIKQLYLQRNSLMKIPAVTSQLTLLSVLDLSRNNIINPLAEPLALPKLRELRLAGNKIKTLDGVTSLLSAPSLHHLDVSNNHISGALPELRVRFPELTTLLASDNTIDEVSEEAVAGLKIVSLSNNELSRLEPRIGLLAGTLTSFDVEGNKFRVPNYTVLKKGTDAVLTWLKDRIPSPTEEFFDCPSPTF
ncbi:hypothetical protein BU23DRAFT_553009 [Bimuria novae-zelandiae CBS 107.79]|uniref:L domain-like protein n=1 Tax=Bimuria novae-zelandiae CBS 107.79 TaxID=1447943 RepID=A0A6A5VC79_9PLEO|nr:hypothetical protein BU23DRAFT_553009 [Bimuria novae-zelandiae CBS 107.79]